jgi:hypothetical protein
MEATSMFGRSRRTPAIAPNGIRLECRLAPAGFNQLATLALPALAADSGGGQSLVDYDPHAVYSYPSRRVSADGQYTVLLSTAANLVPGQIDGNGTFDVFVYDRTADTTTLVSRSAGTLTTASNGRSGEPTISADGRFVAFTSQATDLVAGMSVQLGSHSNLFLFDRVTGGCTLVSHDVGSALLGSSYDAQVPSLSAGGEVVVFISQAVNLVANPGGTGQAANLHVYAYDRATGLVTLVDHAAGSLTTPGNGGGRPGAVSADGRYIAFNSAAANLLAGNTKSKGDAYRFDRYTGTTMLLSRSGIVAPFGGNDYSTPSDMSDDGRWVVLASLATNLVPGASTSGQQVLLCDAQTGQLSIVSHAAGAPLVGGNGASIGSQISGDGNYVAFISRATNLVGGFVDGNGTGHDLFLFDRSANAVVLVSRAAGSPTASANGTSNEAPSISVEGRYVTFRSLATNLIAGFVDGNGQDIYPTEPTNGYDVYRYDRLTDQVELVSGKHGSATQSGNLGTAIYAMSADGKTVAYSTSASDAMAGVVDTNGQDDTYIRDYAAGKTSLASRRAGSVSLSAGGESSWAQVSADGRFVTFISTATNLVPGQVDTEQSPDIFLFDRMSQTTQLVSRSHTSPSTAANGQSGIPMISADGRYVAYGSFATDLIPGFVDSNGPPIPFYYGGVDVYLYDRVTQTNQLVSRQAGMPNVGGNANSASVTGYPDYLLTISDDGRYVGYISVATDLVAGLVNNNGMLDENFTGSDVFVFDRVTGLNSLVSHTPGAPLNTGNSKAFAPSISGDGRYVAYWSLSSNLVSGMTGGGGRNVFLYDRLTGVTALVSHAAGSPTAAGNAGSNEPVISKDGNYVVYQSAATTIVPGTDTNGQDDVFLYERATGLNTLVSHTFSSATTAGNAPSDVSVGDVLTNDAIISVDGRYVVYGSGANDLVAGFVDNNGPSTSGSYPGDVFLFDRVTGINMLVSHTAASATAGGNQPSSNASMSGDGRFITFGSRSTDLPGGDTDYFVPDVYRYDRLLNTTTLVSRWLTGDDLVNSYGSTPRTISRDGSAVVYFSHAGNLVPGDFNSFPDIFAYVTPPPRVQSVTVNDGAPQRSTVRSLTVTFDQPVFFAGSPAAAFALTSQAGSVQLGAGSMVGNSLTLTFSGSLTQFASLIDGKYTLTVLADQVSNVGQLDGNGDGIGGDDFSFGFHRLFGDADGDGDVDAADFGAFRQAFGIGGVAFDFDNDGDVDASDFGQFRFRFGTSI